MQIFIIGTPFETAQALDKRRLNKQIIECRQIMKAIKGESKAWANHPCVKMYRGRMTWLYFYLSVLEDYQQGRWMCAEYTSSASKDCTPPFQTQEYFDQIKRRLYTKDNNHYKQWAHLGESDVNWYYVDGEWLHYRSGKRIVSLGK